MKILISVLVGLSFLSFSAVGAEKKRKVAQEKSSCVPLGAPLLVTGDEGYTAEEFRMLKNSIYAQFGFKFKSSEVANEMAKRGCFKTDMVFSEDKVQGVDRQNARMLKVWEQTMNESDQMTNFQGDWDKAASSPRKRAKLLAHHYCYLSDAKNTYFGVLYFTPNKTAGAFELNGMMNLEKPTWAEPMTDKERAEYQYSVAYRTLDTTSAVILDYASKGTWAINDTRTKNLGQLQITINSDHKNVKNLLVDVTSAKFKEARMLDCKLAE